MFNREEIIELAREAGMAWIWSDVVTTFDELARFAALLEQRLAGAVEPEAWINREHCLLAHAENMPPADKALEEGWEPLYTAPQTQPQQEPVAYLLEYGNGEKEVRFKPMGWGDKVTPLYAAPQQREWVDLTEMELVGAYEEEQQGRWGDHARGLENVQAKLRERNGGRA